MIAREEMSYVDVKLQETVSYKAQPVPIAPPLIGCTPPDGEFDEITTKHLKSHGFTDGMVESLKQTVDKFPQRFWVVDNSGSMLENDGYCVNSTGRMVKCTRWKEIQECVTFFIGLASLLHSPTTFTLLNNPGRRIGAQQFEVAGGKKKLAVEIDEALKIILETNPFGGTPLTNHIHAIREKVTLMKNSLEENGKKVVVVLATDGVPTDSTRDEFVESLRSLENLPIWLVIRLSTNEESVIEYYNDLDTQLELSMDILDDFSGEAAEVYKYNPWINYGLPLHRLREMGCHNRLLDLIDERALTYDELRDFCLLVFGAGRCDGLEDPAVEWNEFLVSIKGIMKTEDLQWNPMRRKMMHWIDVDTLHKKYGNPSAVELLCYHKFEVIVVFIAFLVIFCSEW